MYSQLRQYQEHAYRRLCTIDRRVASENGTVNSNRFAPTKLGSGVKCTDFIVASGVEIGDSTLVDKCFVGQGCIFDKHYSAGESLFFSNCRGMHGEACAIFAGPYTVTHHKSTLLIAGMFSFLNAGSGSNGRTTCTNSDLSIKVWQNAVRRPLRIVICFGRRR